MITLERSATNAPNQFIDVNGRTLAYRSVGIGQPILLAIRFRGNLDLWDPAFIDALAARGHCVITFDYSGLGLSTGAPSYNPIEMAKDIRDLMDALDLENVILGGWSLGGLAAQAALALYPDRISHLVLIGTNPAGQLELPGEQLFYDVAGKDENDLEDYTILFFEPAAPLSRDAARRSLERVSARTRDLSKPVPADFARAHLHGPTTAPFPADFVRNALKTTNVPVLHIGGDHDIIFPVENWYAANREFPTLSLVTFPRTGHGPQHEYPEMSADIIASFVRNTRP
jgi:pimeloyl-ACP methyl ester carboxylesterase